MLGVTIVVASAVALIFALGWLVSQQATQLAEDLPALSARPRRKNQRASQIGVAVISEGSYPMEGKSDPFGRDAIRTVPATAEGSTRRRRGYRRGFCRCPHLRAWLAYVATSNASSPEISRAISTCSLGWITPVDGPQQVSIGNQPPQAERSPTALFAMRSGFLWKIKMETQMVEPLAFVVLIAPAMWLS